MQNRLGTQVHITPEGRKEYQMEQVSELTNKGKVLQLITRKLVEWKLDWIDTWPIKRDLEMVIDDSVHEIYDALLYHAREIDKLDKERIEEANLTLNKYKWEH